MKINYVIAVIIGFIFLVVDFSLFYGAPIFGPLLVVSVLIAASQWIVDFLAATRDKKEIEDKFPEFVRNLVGSVKSGMPINKAIVHVSQIDYGALSFYVRKLANKMEWNIPLHKALVSFSEEVNNRIVKRAIATVIEAEQSGGNIEDVLESITNSLIEIKKLKDKRKSSIHSQVIQSYVIYVVFLVVMVVIQNFLIPWISDVQTQTSSFVGNTVTTGASFSDQLNKVTLDYSSFQGFVSTFSAWLTSIYGVFLMMSLIQGFFAGLVIGKLSEGDARYGFKHSGILMTLSFVVISFAQAL